MKKEYENIYAEPYADAYAEGYAEGFKDGRKLENQDEYNQGFMAGRRVQRMKDAKETGDPEVKKDEKFEFVELVENLRAVGCNQAADYLQKWWFVLALAEGLERVLSQKIKEL